LAYCTANDVRLIADLTTADIDDTTLTNLIAVATQKLNADVVALVKDERVEYIDEVKTNEIDGSNKTFYTKFLYQFWMSRYYDTLRRIMASSIPRRVEGKGIEFK